MNYDELKFPELDMSEENLELLLDVYTRSDSKLYLCNFLRFHSFAEEHLDEETRQEMLDTISDTMETHTAYRGAALEESLECLNTLQQDFFDASSATDDVERRIYWLNHEINRVRNST